MNNTLLEPMENNSIHVHKTNDYSQFNQLDGNRELNIMHRNRLIKSIKHNPLFMLIWVNEKYEVIDGQHRLSIAKELDIPIHYIVINGYGLREVQILNSNVKNWNAEDYLKGYCDLGYKDYITFRKFKNDYDFNITACYNLLGSGGNGDSIKAFHSGDFKVVDYFKSCDYANKINKLKPLYDGYKRLSFVIAMVQLMKNENFNYNEFYSKLSQQRHKMYDCNTEAQYRELIEEIYNYKRRVKVNLKY